MKMRWAAAGAAALVGVAAFGASEDQVDAALGVLDSLDRDIRITTERWIEPLQGMARTLLVALTGISMAWRWIEATLRNIDFQEVVLELVRLAMYAGFFSLVIDWSPEIAQAITGSFAQAAVVASGGAVGGTSPGDVLSTGIAWVGEMIDAASLAAKIPVALVGAAIVLIFAAMAGYMLLVAAEMYVVTAAGVLLLGFGGSQWTDDFAKRYLIYTVSVGGKMFALLLVVAFTMGIFETWQTAGEASGEPVGVVAALGVAFMAVMLAVMLPGMVQGIINGSSIGAGGPALTGMMSAVANTAARSAMGVVKGGSGAAAAARATAAGVGATSVREGVRAMGGGARGTARFAGQAALTGARALAEQFGDRVAPAGSTVERLRGMQAAAEAARDAGPPAKGSVAEAMAKVKAAGPGGSVGPGSSA